jgi:hypothetical protein
VPVLRVQRNAVRHDKLANENWDLDDMEKFGAMPA